MENLEDLLKRTQAAHGHVCAGQVLGVRMAMLGGRLVGIQEFHGEERKKLLVFVETDRCIADAIFTITGCRQGKRTLKYYDYGKMAATFMNIKTGVAYRVAALDSAREFAERVYRDSLNQQERHIRAYKSFSDQRLFRVERVELQMSLSDWPGRPTWRIICDRCREAVNDHREVVKDGKTLCRACAGESYYKCI